MLTTTCRKWAALTRLVLRRAAAIRPSVIAKLWWRSSLALLRYVKMQNISE